MQHAWVDGVASPTCLVCFSNPCTPSSPTHPIHTHQLNLASTHHGPLAVCWRLLPPLHILIRASNLALLLAHCCAESTRQAPLPCRKSRRQPKKQKGLLPADGDEKKKTTQSTQSIPCSHSKIASAAMPCRLTTRSTENRGRKKNLNHRAQASPSFLPPNPGTPANLAPAGILGRPKFSSRSRMTLRAFRLRR